MKRLLKRQRRRLVLFALCVCAPIATVLTAVQLIIAPLPTWASVSVWCALFTLCLGALVMTLRYAPRLRRVADYTSLVILGAIPLIIAFLAFTNLAPIWEAVASLVIIYAVMHAIDHVLPRKTYRGEAKYRTRQSPYAIWSAQYPDPGLLDRHWTPALQRLVLDRRDPDIRRATYDFGFGTLHQEQHLTDMQMHEAFAYDFKTLSDTDLTGASGAYAMMITEHGPWRDVTLNMTLQDRPFSTWLGLWLDDHIGDQADHHLAQDKGFADYSMTASLMRTAPAHQSGLISPEALPA